MKLTLDDHEFDVQVDGDAVVVDGQRYQVSVKGSGLNRSVTVNGRAIPVNLSEPEDGGSRTANVEGKVWQVRASGGTTAVAPVARPEPATPAPQSRAAAPRPSRGAVTAQMAGRVLRVDGEGFDVRLNGGVLRVLRVQPEGAKKIGAGEWAASAGLEVGARFR